MRLESGADTALPSRRGAGRYLIALVAAVLAVAAVPSWAEERKHSWEVGGYIGYTEFGHETQVQSSFDYGFRLRWDLAPPYEIELQYYKSDGSNLHDGRSTPVANEFI